MKKINFIILITIIVTIIFLSCFYFFKNKTINGMIMLIEFERIEGILNWEKELDSLGVTALIKAQDNILEEYPDVFKRLSDKGYEIAGGYDIAPFWDISYEDQYEYMKESQDFIYGITGKKMRVFGSRYFAYNEDTLKAADELGIEYILARGTQEANAVVYAPNEYKVKIISVSNIVFEDMGSGSLCDYSLWARGADANDFQDVINKTFSKNITDLILVSHAYLGGTRLDWWNVYLNALNSPKVVWSSFDSWVSKVKIILLPNENIPINSEVKYVLPTPAKAIEDFEPIENLEELLTEQTEFCPVCY